MAPLSDIGQIDLRTIRNMRRDVMSDRELARGTQQIVLRRVNTDGRPFE